MSDEGGLSESEDDSQALLDAVLPLAEQQLLEHGDINPYGGAITSSGEAVQVASQDDDDGEPLSRTDSMSVIRKAFIEAAASKEYKCTALVRAARVASPETNEEYDAIAIELDHETDYSVVVYVPYSLVDDAIEYGETFIDAGENEIFLS